MAKLRYGLVLAAGLVCLLSEALAAPDPADLLRKSDTARVEKEMVTQPPDLLGMGMPACQHLTGIGSQNLLKFFLGYGRQNRFIKGSGGAVNTQQVEPLFQPDRDRWLKFGDKVHIVFAEL